MAVCMTVPPATTRTAPTGGGTGVSGMGRLVRTTPWKRALPVRVWVFDACASAAKSSSNAIHEPAIAILRRGAPLPSYTGPRSPIMHFTDPPPFFRNSLTSMVMGVVPRSRIWAFRSSETPSGMNRKHSVSPGRVRVKELAA